MVGRAVRFGLLILWESSEPSECSDGSEEIQSCYKENTIFPLIAHSYGLSAPFQGRKGENRGNSYTLL